MKVKVCTKCKIAKSVDLFVLDKYRKDGLSCRCKDCRNTYYNNYYKNNPEKALEKNKKQKENRKNFYNSEKGIVSSRKAHLKTKFGITLEEYNKLSEKQNHVCQICGKTEMNSKNKVLCIDHNHNTGEIRGLLCGLCNTALGNFLDKKELLINAIKYLEKYDK